VYCGQLITRTRELSGLVKPRSEVTSCPAPMGNAVSRADSLIVGGREFQGVRILDALDIHEIKFSVFRDQSVDSSGVLNLVAKIPTAKVYVRCTFSPHDNGRLCREILDSMHLA
jgi:hypothetical protein